MSIFKKIFNKVNKEKNAKNDINNVPDLIIEKTEDNMYIPCRKCSGFYKIRDGRFGLFAGCSNYPNCTSTLSVPDFVLTYLKIYGLNIYSWKRVCYKCQKNTNVFSYFLNYELVNADDFFSSFFGIGLGDLEYIDNILSERISTVKMRYSKTTNSKYMANTCEHCGALQGRNYVVDDPHEIIRELWHDRGMDKYLYMRLEIEENEQLRNVINNIYSNML